MNKLIILTLIVLLSCIKRNKVDPNKIVIWEQEDGNVVNFIDSTIGAFNAIKGNEELKISRTHYNNEDLISQFQTASIAGSGPDLIISPPDNAGVYSVSGFITPVDEHFELSKYSKTALDAIRLNGKTWGIPISSGNHLMLFYNKKFVSSPPETTNEMLDVCKKNKDLKTCIAFNMGEPFWFVPWLGAFGGWPIEDKVPTLNTPELIKTIEFYLDLKFNKKLTPLECDYNCADALFKESKAAFLINGDWSISTYLNVLKEDLAITKLPKISETDKWPTPMISGKYFMISSNVKGEKLKLIKDFINFYTNKENQIAQIRAIKRLPALKAAMNSDIVEKDKILKASMDQLKFGKAMSMATEMRAIWDSMRPYLGKALTKKLSPKEAAQKMQLDAVLKIKEMNE